MIEFLTNIWDSLPILIKIPLYVLFNVVLLRGIVAKRLTTFFEDRGYFDHFLVEPVIREWGRLRIAIRHEIDLTRGFKHEQKLDHCTYGECQAL